jgi:hypothetical protein
VKGVVDALHAMERAIVSECASERGRTARALSGSPTTVQEAGGRSESSKNEAAIAVRTT